MNFAAQVFVVQVAAQEDGLDHLAEFGGILVRDFHSLLFAQSPGALAYVNS